MVRSKWLWVAGLLLSVGCTKTNGAWGPQGYEQSMVKYRVNFAEPTEKRFLSDEWRLDNYSYDPSSKKWKEKTGKQYRAERRLDEDGDGTIVSSEKHEESIYDLRFVNIRDNAVIWLKVHPMEAANAGLDLDVLLEGYADGLEGTGLFEQSTLFGLVVDKARHFTTFMVEKQPTSLGNLPAIRGVIEVADVEKLRLDGNHRDSKAELIFAKVTYLEDLGPIKPSASRWPVVTGTTANGQYVRYKAQHTGLLVIGYYDDAARFDSHLPDLHALVAQIVIPESAIPADAKPVVVAANAPEKTATTEATPAVPAASAATAPEGLAATAQDAAPAPQSPAVTSSSASSAVPASVTPPPPTAADTKAAPKAAAPASPPAKK